MKKHVFFIATCLYAFVSNAQNVGVGTSNPLNKLHVAGGLRLDTLTGVNGSGLVTHNANGVIYGLKFSGNANDVLRGDGTFGSGGTGGSPANVWLLSGNSGTNPETNFLGTTDNQPLLFRVNNIRHGYLGNNIFLGSNAGLLNTGRGNIAIGSGALQNNASSSALVAVGDSALFNNVGSLQNTAVGTRTLYSNTSGISNSAFGFKSMESNTIGNDNSSFGTASLRYNLQGVENTAMGSAALALNTNGNRNSAMGAYALLNNTTGNDNTAIGRLALVSNTDGSQNTAIGSSALYANVNGNGNTAMGFESLYANIPGLKVVSPSNSYDAKGLLKQAIRYEEDPVCFMEAETAYGDKGEVPDGEYYIELGKADVKKQGREVTIVSFNKMMKVALGAAAELEKEGVSAEVIDLRTIRPLDWRTVLDSVKKTNRLVIVEEQWPFGSVSSELSYQIQKEGFDYLDAPIRRITAADAPLHYAPNLVTGALPDVPRTVKLVKEVMYLKK